MIAARKSMMRAIIVELCAVFLLWASFVTAVPSQLSEMFPSYPEMIFAELAQTSSQFKAQLVDKIMQDTTGQYTQENVDLITKALVLMRNINAKGWRNSFRTFENHLIGTASCMMRADMSPMWIAATLMHGVYIQHWNEELYPQIFDQDFCAARRFIMSLLGEEMEHIEWIYAGLTATGPNARTLWQIASTIEEDPSSFSAEEDRNILVLTLCDEIDEHHSGEQWWSYGWKGRYDDTYAQLNTIVEYLDIPALREMMHNSVRSSRYLFSPVDNEADAKYAHKYEKFAQWDDIHGLEYFTFETSKTGKLNPLTLNYKQNGTNMDNVSSVSSVVSASGTRNNHSVEFAQSHGNRVDKIRTLRGESVHGSSKQHRHASLIRHASFAGQRSPGGIVAAVAAAAPWASYTSYGADRKLNYGESESGADHHEQLEQEQERWELGESVSKRVDRETLTDAQKSKISFERRRRWLLERAIHMVNSGAGRAGDNHRNSKFHRIDELQKLIDLQLVDANNLPAGQTELHTDTYFSTKAMLLQHNCTDPKNIENPPKFDYTGVHVV